MRIGGGGVTGRVRSRRESFRMQGRSCPLEMVAALKRGALSHASSLEELLELLGSGFLRVGVGQVVVGESWS